jgi:hypothetical protein
MDYAFFALLISIFISRFIQINAFKNLADEDKGKVLSKGIMQLSQVSLIFSIVLIAAFYFCINKYPDKATTLTSSFFIVLIVQRIIVYFFARKRMVLNNVPDSYLTRYFFAWLVTTIGVALFIVLFMWQFNNGFK